MGDLAGRPLVWNIVKIKVLGIYSHFIFRFISLLCLRSRLLLLGKLNWWFLTHTWAWQLSTCSSTLYHNTVKRKREYVMSSNHFCIQYFKRFIATHFLYIYRAYRYFLFCFCDSNLVAFKRISSSISITCFSSSSRRLVLAIGFGSSAWTMLRALQPFVPARTTASFSSTPFATCILTAAKLQKKCV